MLNNFIYAQTKDLFLEKLNAGEVLYEAIVFIEDTKEIWNHGHYFAGESIDPELLEQIQTSIQELKANVNDNPFEKGDAENSAVLKGTGASATGVGATAIGQGIASGDYSFASGGGTQIIEGYVEKPTASGQYSHAEGAYTEASGKCAHAEGRQTVASNQAAHAEGMKTVASGEFSHAEGHNTIASETNAHAEGGNTEASGWYSHAEGYGTKAISDFSHSEGKNTTANGAAAHAEGEDNFTEGVCSHVEGYSNTISKDNTDSSHAEGEHNSVIPGAYASHVEGEHNIVRNRAEHASGQYNKSTKSNDKSKATHFSIGFGTSDTNRKNAFEVKQNGDIYIEGVEGRIQDKLDKLVEITYSELKSLRDDSKLIPGQQYRVTDYVTTTAQLNTQSAGHQFDIIVTADDEKTLNEVARACRSEFDIEKYKDAYSQTWGERMTYLGTYEYYGKIYHRYESESQDMQMLVDFREEVEDISMDDTEHYRYRVVPSYLNNENNGWESEASDDIVFTHNPAEASYFNGSNLAAWQIWYSLDNDTERFAWADAENGKGVIYRMIDEWGNDCPYDFKNIQFKRNLTFENGYAQFSEDGDETWVYTFAGQSYHINNDEYSGMLDGSLESPFGHMSDENTSTFHDNVIKPYIMLYNNNEIRTECGIRYLNDIVFLGYWEKIGSANEEDTPYYYAYCCYSNSFGNDCHSNSLGNNCYSNSLGNNCNFNSLGNNCYSNSFGNDCYYNSFGNDYYSNSFGNNCYSNSFGNNCYSNSFGNNCAYNSFDNGCNYNSFGDSCDNNSFGDSCDNNSFDNGCNSNSFGSSCLNNSFGANCRGNSLGESCDNNSFVNNCCANSLGNDCYDNDFGSSCSNNSFGNGCYNNRFGNGGSNNVFGNHCFLNSFGYSLGSNSFGNYYNRNSFGNDVYYNSFGNNCSDNSFGNHCYRNSFGNSCFNNSFGNYCSNNSFENSCGYNSFRTSASTTGTLKDYCYNNSFDDGCSYNVIWNNSSTGSSVGLKNINVNRGVHGTSSNYNFINIDTLNADYEIQVAKNSKGEIKIYCEADLIA